MPQRISIRFVLRRRQLREAEQTEFRCVRPDNNRRQDRYQIFHHGLATARSHGAVRILSDCGSTHTRPCFAASATNLGGRVSATDQAIGIRTCPSETSNAALSPPNNIPAFSCRRQVAANNGCRAPLVQHQAHPAGFRMAHCLDRNGFAGAELRPTCENCNDATLAARV